jgi:predicted CxxxxCH...CXXCH cytochrome family protein
MSARARRLLPAALAALAAAASGCNPSPLSDGIARPYDCNSCHGSAANSEAARGAPPRGLHGVTATTEVGVGAHQLHLRNTAIRQAIACSECHVVPAKVEDPGHVDQPHATITWGPLASHGTSPTWSREAASCSAVYCHGATLHGGREPSPVWTFAAEPTFTGPFTEICATCHGWPPPPPHTSITTCSSCHPGTVHPDGTIDVAGGLHIDGKVDATCGACHSVPPPTGAHLVHFGDTSSPPLATYGDLQTLADYYPVGAPYYMFGCGNCHPMDGTKHLDGVVEVELYDAAAPSGSLKARNPSAAAYGGQPGLSSGSCSNVYCHSTGQETPGVYALTPVWDSGTSLGCNGCHDNPPRYPSGGPGTSTANGHLAMDNDGYEWGHFAGLPGTEHGSSQHGGAWGPNIDASPITCQTCHYETVDPTNTGPSQFYYLDTTGNYDLGGNLHYACGICHTGAAGEPATASGKVLPLRHVNGERDVRFDPRTIIDRPISWLPAAPNTPTRPIWLTRWQINTAPPPDAVYDGSTVSMHLGSADYDPTSKTCTNVSCHLAQTVVTWGAPFDISGSCVACHPDF